MNWTTVAPFAGGGDSGFDRGGGAGTDDDDVGHRTGGDSFDFGDEIIAGDHDCGVGAEFTRSLRPPLEQIRADDHAGTHLARQPDVHHAHDAEADHEDRFAGTKTGTAQGFDHQAAGSTRTPSRSETSAGSLSVSRWLVAPTTKNSAIPPGVILVARQVSHWTYSPRRHGEQSKQGA